MTKCYRGRSNSGNGDRVPSRQEQHLFLPYLDEEIALINPVLIIPVGRLAIQLFYLASLSLLVILRPTSRVPAPAKRAPRRIKSARLDKSLCRFYHLQQSKQMLLILVSLGYRSGARRHSTRSEREVSTEGQHQCQLVPFRPPYWKYYKFTEPHSALDYHPLLHRPGYLLNSW